MQSAQMIAVSRAFRRPSDWVALRVAVSKRLSADNPNPQTPSASLRLDSAGKGCTSRCHRSHQFDDFEPEVLVLLSRMRTRRKVTFRLTTWAVNTLAAARSERDASPSDLPARHISRQTLDRNCRFCPDMFAAFRNYPEKGDVLLDPLPGRR